MSNSTLGVSSPTNITMQKSRGTALLLVFLFGPIGLLYSSVIGGIVMTILAVMIGFLTFGLGLLLIWPVCLLWVLFFPGTTQGKITY